MRVLYLFLTLVVSLATTGEAQQASLRGSRSAMIRQNQVVKQENLSRIKGSLELRRFHEAELLVPLPANKYVRIDRRLPGYRRLTRPWTRQFLLDFGAGHYKSFNRSIQVNSAVRTHQAQVQLRKKNRNAARASGPLASSHLTGSTVDITKKGMSARELRWVRKELLRLERLGLIEATEERRQAVFHIMVYRKYVQVQATKKALLR